MGAHALGAQHMSVYLLLALNLIPSQAGTNWPVTGDIHRVSDPAIIQSGGKYYIYCSGRGLPVRGSSDLHHWERLAPVFAEVPRWALASVPDARDFWAPDISFRDGRYWLYYSVSTLGSRRSAIGLATNVTLDPRARTITGKTRASYGKRVNRTTITRSIRMPWRGPTDNCIWRSVPTGPA